MRTLLEIRISRNSITQFTSTRIKSIVGRITKNHLLHLANSSTVYREEAVAKRDTNLHPGEDQSPNEPPKPFYSESDQKGVLSCVTS
jgi:hypothetical protein